MDKEHEQQKKSNENILKKHIKNKVKRKRGEKIKWMIQRKVTFSTYPIFLNDFSLVVYQFLHQNLLSAIKLHLITFLVKFYSVKLCIRIRRVKTETKKVKSTVITPNKL